MPAPFTAQLCGYRADGQPNTCDRSDSLSKALGRQMFQALGVPDDRPGPTDPGGELERRMLEHLSGIRPDLQVGLSRSAVEFDQYAHLGVFPRFRSGHAVSDLLLAELGTAVDAVTHPTERATLGQALNRVRERLTAQDQLALDLLANMPEEALLRIDLTVAEPRPVGLPHVHIAVSAKWSLRTDRAQDCVSQGAKLVSQRRGRMPHFAVVTMEPRPSMLKILCDGSGAVDCVYHLDLPTLEEAVQRAASAVGRRRWTPMETFRRLVDQRRLRDYDELVAQVQRLPAA